MGIRVVLDVESDFYRSLVGFFNVLVMCICLLDIKSMHCNPYLMYASTRARSCCRGHVPEEIHVYPTGYVLHAFPEDKQLPRAWHQVNSSSGIQSNAEGALSSRVCHLFKLSIFSSCCCSASSPKQTRCIPL